MQAPAKKPLILVGGSARAAASSAVRGGCDVWAIDRFGDADLLALCRRWLPLTDPRRLLKQVASLPPAPVVPLGGCEHLGAWVERAATVGGLCGADANQFRRSQSLTTLRQIAKRAGVGFPATYRFTSTAGPPPAAAAGWLIKRQVRCGGQDVRRWDGRLTPPAGHYLQQRIVGRSLGACYLAATDGTVLLGVCAALRCGAAQSPFIYAGSLGPLSLDSTLARRLQRLGQIAAELLGLRGLFNIDLMATRSAEIYLLEINPRYSASMELLEETVTPSQAMAAQTRGSVAQPVATLMAAHVAAVAGHRAFYPPPQTLARCKRIVYAPHDLRFDPPEHSGAAELASSAGPRGVVCDLPARGSLIRRGHPAFTCVAEAGTLREAQRLTAQLARETLRRCAIGGAAPAREATAAQLSRRDR